MWKTKYFSSEHGISLQVSINNFLQEHQETIMNAQISYDVETLPRTATIVHHALLTYDLREDEDRLG